jgi:hypothetical protein
MEVYENVWQEDIGFVDKLYIHNQSLKDMALNVGVAALNMQFSCFLWW